MRFTVVGSFTGTSYAAMAGKQQQPKAVAPNATKNMVIQWIQELGGRVYDKDSTMKLILKTAKTPNCFIVLKDDIEVMNGTMTAQELADARPKKAAKKKREKQNPYSK